MTVDMMAMLEALKRHDSSCPTGRKGLLTNALPVVDSLIYLDFSTRRMLSLLTNSLRFVPTAIYFARCQPS